LVPMRLLLPAARTTAMTREGWASIELLTEYGMMVRGCIVKANHSR
jgi:hypothetical protein